MRLVSRWVLTVSFFQFFCEFDVFIAKYWGVGGGEYIPYLWTGLKIPLTPNELSDFPKCAKPMPFNREPPLDLVKMRL